MSDVNQLASSLALTLLPNISLHKIYHWLETFHSPQKLLAASVDEWQAAGLQANDIAALQTPPWQAVQRELLWQEQSSRYIVCIQDKEYPSLLKEISDPPLVLYVYGDKSVLNCQQLAIVGARNATPIGVKDAHDFAYHLAKAGMAITSGLALGIDGASHQGALAAKGKTIAVMGTGQHHIYPSQHLKLAKQIAENGGALISEFPLATSPKPYHFPRRNRIISGMSLGVLVVEAAVKSGSLITATYALEQNREVFAIPGSIHNVQSRGCHRLIRQGAKLVESAHDILEELNGFSSISHKPVKNSPQLSEKESLLLAQINYATTPIDVIVLRSGLTVNEVSSILLSLELAEYVTSVTGGYARI